MWRARHQLRAHPLAPDENSKSAFFEQRGKYRADDTDLLRYSTWSTDRLGKSKTCFLETARNAAELGVPPWLVQLAEVSALLRPEKPSVA
jgi:hypothetical protein